VEVRAVGKKTVITPRLAVDRSKFPNTHDEYPGSGASLMPAWTKPKRDLYTAHSRTATRLRLSSRRKPECCRGRQIAKIRMNVRLSQAAIEGLFDAPLLQKAFIKQINYLVRKP